MRNGTKLQNYSSIQEVESDACEQAVVTDNTRAVQYIYAYFIYRARVQMSLEFDSIYKRL